MANLFLAAGSLYSQVRLISRNIELALVTLLAYFPELSIRCQSNKKTGSREKATIIELLCLHK